MKVQIVPSHELQIDANRNYSGCLETILVADYGLEVEEIERHPLGNRYTVDTNGTPVETIRDWYIGYVLVPVA